ncbi:3-oxoacyl-ACP reductase FabG [Candidatus Deianiraea vastatrix]|uniref:3-oxoacyl-[acyl-carrier-protein] reductase FabG n=1 Tax=Candidatus Deianiraea vastatrix TaxID=2163644 RepID=A0A5B8XEU2_9RICK|nr:3-oxoacyl-ACP reductase FabG [Candidatus Deianiraea vastatrix]QED23783.1 3-oxoacyl-[acyl-carrier-protein] reductase FabG [Candidatus Deianiraea vastatrix]
MNYLDFAGKNVVITGATGGIGGAIFDAFYKCGARVLATSTSSEKIEKLFEKYEDKSRLFSLIVNMKNKDEVENLCKNANEKMGGLDVIICNAGLTKDGLAMRMKTEDFQEVIDINLTSNFILNREAGKIMMKNRFGRVINIASIVGFTGNMGQANYVASKAGLAGMTKTMAVEFATRGVTFNCIAPGFIETAMTDAIPDAAKQAILSKIPVGSQGKPEDIAYAALFLASNNASYITGTTIHVNGGMFM